MALARDGADLVKGNAPASDPTVRVMARRRRRAALPLRCPRVRRFMRRIFRLAVGKVLLFDGVNVDADSDCVVIVYQSLEYSVVYYINIVIVG